MGHEIDLKNYEIRTDLVLETIENKSSNIETKTSNHGDIKVTKVIVDSNTSTLINKKEGTYITIEFDDVTDTGNREKVEEIFISELQETIYLIFILLITNLILQKLLY